MPNRGNYEPVAHDNSRVVEPTGLGPAHPCVSDGFLHLVTWNIRYLHHHNSIRVGLFQEMDLSCLRT